MIATTIGMACIVAQTVVGWHDHGRDRSPAGVGCCDTCGVEKAAVISQIIRLQSSPTWRAREDAAHDLRRVNWRCHPEVLGALAFTVMNDCEEEVREEAVESLAKMEVCVPVVHEALSRAAAIDPDGPTRRKARRTLRKVAKYCQSPCTVCGTSAVVVIPPAAPVIGPTLIEPLETPPVVGPPSVEVVPPQTDLTPIPPIDSSVAPSAAPGIETVPPAIEGTKPDANGGLSPLHDQSGRRVVPRPTARVITIRPRVATFLPGVLRPRPNH